jgi:hypothetical protein
VLTKSRQQMIKSRQGRNDLVFAWWRTSGDTSRSWRRRSGYATLARFDGFCLKTTGDGFAGFGPQKPGEDLGAARGISKELVSRRSIFAKRSRLSNVQNSTWTILPLWLSGSRKISRNSFGVCNSPINKSSGCSKTALLPSRSLEKASLGFHCLWD